MGIRNGHLRESTSVLFCHDTNRPDCTVCQELLTREVPYGNLVPYASAARNEPKILKVLLDGFLPEAPNFNDFENSAIFRALWSIARKCWNEISSRGPSARDVLNGLEFFVNDF